LLGLLLLAAIVATSYLKIRSERRSGATHSFGHSLLDNILLLGSALLLIAGLGLTLLIFKGINPHAVAGHYIFLVVLISLGGALTWLCNAILRRSKRRR